MKPAMLQHDSAFFACTELHITSLLLIIQTSFLRHIQKPNLKVHKNENFFGFDFEFCTISLLVMHK